MTINRLQLLKILNKRNVNYYALREDSNDINEMIEILGSSFKDALNEYKKGVKAFRLFSNNSDQYGNIKSYNEIVGSGCSLEFYIPVSWIQEKKSHLPKWW